MSSSPVVIMVQYITLCGYQYFTHIMIYIPIFGKACSSSELVSSSSDVPSSSEVHALCNHVNVNTVCDHHT